MKRPVIVFLLITAVLCVQSCKNNLNVLAPYKDITVVYGLLDQNDSTHYIRINRAYQGAGNAYTMATQYDSINYPVGVLTVQLLDYSNGSLANTITLDTTTTVPMDPGIFSYPKQLLYYTKQALNPADQYNLVITNNKTNNVITGSTTLLPDVSVANYNSDFLSNTAINLTSSFQYPSTVSWTSNAQAMIYQLNMVFYYNEIDSIKKDTTTKSIEWGFAEQTSTTLAAGYPMEVQYTGEEFLLLVRTSISAPPINTKRVPLYMLVQFTSGTMDLNTYVLLSQPSLNVNQEKPFFTDLKNAVGIFTARHVQQAIRPLTSQTVDSLMNGKTDQGLNFKVQ